MKALDFTKKKSKLVDKLVKLGFHYQSTDTEKPDGLRKPSRLITTWANVMNGVTLQISQPPHHGTSISSRHDSMSRVIISPDDTCT